MPIAFAIIAIIAGFALAWVVRRRVMLDFLLALLVLCVSGVVLARGLAHPVWGVANPTEIQNLKTMFAGLPLVCVLGFSLCPYLDLTFHRARQETTPGAGKLAFAVGFGVVFLAMIVLTLLYAGDFGPTVDSRGSFGRDLLISWVAVHIAAQAGFTLTAHLRALPARGKGDVLVWAGGAVILGLAIFTVQQQRYFDRPFHSSWMLTGDMVYRLFMSFYGLIFPAYVWICMVPIRGRAPGPTPRALLTTVIAIAIAAPMYWLGFVNEWMLWLIPAVTVVLVARVFVSTGTNRRASTEPSSSAAGHSH